jgi:hypothetical protein
MFLYQIKSRTWSWVTPRHVILCHVMLCLHVMSCHVMSCHVISYHIISCHVMSPCHVMSCHVFMSCHVSCSCDIKSCLHVMLWEKHYAKFWGTKLRDSRIPRGFEPCSLQGFEPVENTKKWWIVYFAIFRASLNALESCTNHAFYEELSI